MAGPTIVVATTGRPGLIKPEQVAPGPGDPRADQPRPRRSPRRSAEEAGAAFAADGTVGQQRARLPRHLPRRARRSGAGEISTGMKLAAARAIAGLDRGAASWSPTRSTRTSTPRSPTAVAEAARAEGLARPERVRRPLARQLLGRARRPSSSIGSVSLPVKVFCWLGW